MQPLTVILKQTARYLKTDKYTMADLKDQERRKTKKHGTMEPW